MSTIAEEPLREQAIARLRKRRDFAAHLLVFILINTATWVIWFATGASGWPWPIFLTLFWGVGLVMNAWDVYFRRPITEDEVQHEISRLRGAV